MKHSIESLIRRDRAVGGHESGSYKMRDQIKERATRQVCDEIDRVWARGVEIGDTIKLNYKFEVGWK